MKHVGAIIQEPQTGNLMIRYNRSLYSFPLRHGTAMEVKTEDGWKKTRLLYDMESEVWGLQGQPHRNLAGLIVRTEEIL